MPRRRSSSDGPPILEIEGAVVISGNGDVTFSSGYTVDAIVERLDRTFEDLLSAVESFSLLTTCALNGSVYGEATDLALCRDFRTGVRGMRMFMPAAKLGLHYDPGGMRRYVTALGFAHAKRLFLTTQTLRDTEMLRIGFLTELVERGALWSRVAPYLAALAACERQAVRSMKPQPKASAGGARAAARPRSAYEASLNSAVLKARLASRRRC